MFPGLPSCPDFCLVPLVRWCSFKPGVCSPGCTSTVPGGSTAVCFAATCFAATCFPTACLPTSCLVLTCSCHSWDYIASIVCLELSVWRMFTPHFLGDHIHLHQSNQQAQHQRGLTPPWRLLKHVGSVDDGSCLCLISTSCATMAAFSAICLAS